MSAEASGFGAGDMTGKRPIALGAMFLSALG
jgi:hypothetical protein